LLLTGERDGYYADFGSFADLGKSLQQAFVYDGHYSTFRKRRHGRASTGISAHNFISYLQNHDQIGNRAQGERSSHLLNSARLKIAAALVLTGPFVPMLFQGEEWGATSPFLYFTDHEDPALGRTVIEGRRREFAAFGWDPEAVPDPQALQSFERSKLNWDELDQDCHADLLEWHRRLIKLRRETSALSDGRLEELGVNFDETAKWFVVKRGMFLLACNLNTDYQNVPEFLGAGSQMLLGSDSRIRITTDGLQLPPNSVTLVRKATVSAI
jgi:maltooligosyltrehalose trehalohydrolase